jgi:hypothetical protein
LCSYQRTNKDRSYYEHMEIENARSWQQQAAHRRATQVALKALRDPEKLAMDEVCVLYVVLWLLLLPG